MKYIVFCTINQKDNRILIGVHGTNDPSMFDGYIGDNVYINQNSTFMYPKTPFQCAVKKYGVQSFKRITLYIYENYREAQSKYSQIVTNDFIEQDFTYNGYDEYMFTSPEGHESPIYQFTLDGTLVKEWKSLNDIVQFYNKTSPKFAHAIITRHMFIGYYWSFDKSIDVEKYNPKDLNKVTHLYTLGGKWLKEFTSLEDCAEFLGVDIKTILESVKTQYRIGNYYVSNALTDLFIPKARRQCLHTRFYLYKNKEFIGEYIGKDLLRVIKETSWTKLRNRINDGGWWGDFYISLSKISEDEIPERKKREIRIDVYTKYGDFIESINSIKEVREKYNIPSAKMKRIQQGDKYFGEYIFKYNNK